jgi:hypothetical protein
MPTADSETHGFRDEDTHCESCHDDHESGETPWDEFDRDGCKCCCCDVSRKYHPDAKEPPHADSR